ncbi:nucleotidyltransferase family protein [Psychrobium sp. nBUS_13]|uniref:nucleotidyltransferase family protein n=1 Tax=Psychrobium sp. nBUS_13 TaxID=3395319 RepID=UPI003EC0853F
MKWKEILISPDTSIKSTLRVIDTNALRVALVVDSEDKLLGIVSDGDIRRAIIADTPLSQSITSIMNTTPITAPFNTKKSKLAALMQEKDILAVPLLKQGKVVGLSTLSDSLSQRSFENPVLIMAGGFGTRLGHLTKNCPKPMLKVGAKPMLESIIEQFIKVGFSNFYISTHYMAEKIHDYFGNGSHLGINITYVHEETPLGTGGALSLLPADIPSLPLILMNGDILTQLDASKLLDFHDSEQADATMCVRPYEYTVPFGVIEGPDSKITSIVEKPSYHFLINAGIYVINPSVYQSIEMNTAIDMPDIFNNMLTEKQNVAKFPIHEYWLDIGQTNDFDQAQHDILTLSSK